MNKLKKILLIDDDDVTCFINKLFLQGLDIAEEIACVHDGIEGLSYLQKNCSASALEEGGGTILIFLDNRMPIMDGFDFLEAYDELETIDKSRIYIVMLTTSVNIKDIQKAATFGDILKGYINKPLDINFITQVLSEILALEKKSGISEI